MAQRQKLKLQFAKADKNRDGYLDAREAMAAVHACAAQLPFLTKVPTPVIDSHILSHTGPKGLDINGFIKVSNDLMD